MAAWDASLAFERWRFPGTSGRRKRCWMRPDMVRDIHADYIAAGADVITTNTYCTLRSHLDKAGVGDRYVELNRLAGQLAVEAARDAADRPASDCWVIGSPMFESYRPDMVLPAAESEPVYREQAEIAGRLCGVSSSARPMSKSDEAVGSGAGRGFDGQAGLGIVQSASVCAAWVSAQRGDRSLKRWRRWTECR